MSNIIYDFLTSSKLSYPKYITTNYNDLSEEELSKELNAYRQHIAHNSQKIFNEIENKDHIAITCESFGKLPDETLFKQLVLYVDKIIVDDPIYPQTSFDKSDFSRVFNTLMKTNGKNEIDRQQLSCAVDYMISNSILVSNGILKFFPMELLHRQNENIPLYYSENNFADSVPVEYRKFFIQRAKVYNINDNAIYFDAPLTIGRNIYIEFDGAPITRGMGYALMHAEYKEIDRDKGLYQMISHIPDELPNKIEFDTWIEQSINKTAGRIFQDTFNEVLFSKQFNSMYLTQSAFTSQLLSVPYLPFNNISSDLANLALKLDLPIINGIPLDTLLNIRISDGQAFENFRISLHSKLKVLRLINDPIALKKNIENLEHELVEEELHSVDKAYRDITRKLGIDTLMLVGSLMSSYFSGGLTLVGAAGALLKGSVDFAKYHSDVKENNGYFLWKVKKASPK